MSCSKGKRAKSWHFLKGSKPSENKTFLEIGERAEYSRKVSADDIRRFAEISGDFAPIHIDEAFAQTTPYGKTIAHGALLMGLLSATSTMIAARSKERGAPGTPVSLGYDRIRIIKPVFAEDLVIARYTLESVDDHAGRTRSKVEIVNQQGDVCLVGSHIMKWVLD
jgi:3-hydroxybutyryl-CoA dehydratase